MYPGLWCRERLSDTRKARAYLQGRIRSEVTGKTARWIGALGALVLGAVALDLFPPLGLLETVAAIAVLITHRRAAALVAILPTFLILSSAILVMVTASGLDNPIMWPIAVGAGLTVIALIRGGTLGNKAHLVLS